MSESGRLLRCYTQNIDGLEEREGMTTNLALGKGKRKRASTVLAGVVDSEEEKGCQVVQLHGDLKSLRCTQCQGLCKYDKERVESLLDGTPPECPVCAGKDKERRESGKRGTKVGNLRPNIVLYGEEHPLAEKIGSLTSADLRSNPDIMIILGTSLKVFGLKRIVREFARAVHARGGKVIYVNNTPAAYSTWKDVIDYHVDMDCDAWVADVKKRRFDIWERQLTLYLGKVTKKAAPASPSKLNESKKIFKEIEQENEIKARPKATATGSRKPLGTMTGNGPPGILKKISSFTIPMCPPTPPPTNGSRPEKKSTGKRASTPYNPPSAPSTPTGRRSRSAAMPLASILATPQASPSRLISKLMSTVRINSATKERLPYSPRRGNSGCDTMQQSPLPKAKRRMLVKSKPVTTRSKGKGSGSGGNLELEVCGTMTPIKPLQLAPGIERRVSRRLSKLPAEIPA